MGPGLWKRVVSNLQTQDFHKRAETVVISPDTTVDFVYDVLELPNVLLVWRCLMASFLICILALNTEPIDLH